MTKSILTLVAFFLFSISSIAQSTSEINREYPEAKSEVKEALDEIEQSIRNNEIERLIEMHAYGPKFTEFKPMEKRTGSKENEAFERNFLGSITEVEDWNWNDLKIAVYGGDVAAVTFHSDFKFKTGEDPHHFETQGMLLFIKTDEGWKIAHEHLAPLNKSTDKAQVSGIKNISKSEFPKGNMLNLVKDWGGMVVAINEPKAGTDFTPLLKGQKDDLCQVPHWGYLEKGTLEAKYQQQPWKTISAGEVFYMPPGHTAKVMEDARIIDFSPQEEMMSLMADIQKNMNKN